MWKEIKKTANTPESTAKKCFRVQRNTSTKKEARLVIPPTPGLKKGDRARIFANGDSLGFIFSERGEYSVFKPSPRSRALVVSIPRKFVERIPFGTTEADVSHDGGMLVLDLSQFDAARLSAAE